MPFPRPFGQALLRNVYSGRRCALQVVGKRDELVSSVALQDGAEQALRRLLFSIGCDSYRTLPEAVLTLRFGRPAFLAQVTNRTSPKTGQCTGHTFLTVLLDDEPDK